MKTLRLLLITALLAASTGVAASPASAEEGDPSGAGLTCGLEATRVGPSINAVVTGGPYAVVDPAAQVVIRCIVEIVRSPGVYERVGEASSLPGAAVAFLEPRLMAVETAVTNAMGMRVCTEVTVRRPGHPPDVREFDSDGDLSNGVQCDSAPARLNDDIVDIYVGPPRLWHTPCVRVWVLGNGPIGVCP